MAAAFHLAIKLGDDQKLEYDPATVPLALDVFTSYAAGETQREIAADCNQRGLKTG